MKAKLLGTVLKRIGVALKALREKKGFHTIKDFSTKYKLPLVQYWRIEKGKANMTIKTLTQLLAIHRLTIEDFFCLMDKPN